MGLRFLRPGATGAALGALLLGSWPAWAQLGSTIEEFDHGPMVTQGQVQFLEPFSLHNHTINGVTYRATENYHKACQIMLVVQNGTIRSEIFAIPVVSETEVLKAQRDLLDAFLGQTGLAGQYHSQVREQMVDALNDGQQVRQMGGYAVQTLMLPADVPLLVLAIARDVASLPLPHPRPKGTVQQ